MFLLTKHAKEKIKKRLIKKDNVDSFQIWKKALEFYENAKYSEDSKFIYFTNHKYTLIVTKETKEPLYRGDALKLLRLNKNKEFNIYDSKTKALFRVSREKAFEIVSKDKVYLTKESEDIFIGKPRIAITFRPFKEGDIIPMEYKLTIKEKWLRKLIRGEKEWEVRNSIPKGLKEGDIIEFYDKKKKVKAKFRVLEIKLVPLEEALKYKIGISKAVLFQLAKKNKVYLLRLEPID